MSITRNPPDFLSPYRHALALCTGKEAPPEVLDLLAARPTYDLVMDFEQSMTLPLTPGLPTARGWLMDELERRDPQAFNQWLESDETSPRTFFTL